MQTRKSSLKQVRNLILLASLLVLALGGIWLYPFNWRLSSSQEVSSGRFEALFQEVPLSARRFSKKDRSEFEFYKDVFSKQFPLLARSRETNYKIPQVIHFIWLGPKPFPAESVKNVASWKLYHPSWVMKFWTDSVDRPCPIEGMEKHLVSEVAFTKSGHFIEKTKNYAEQSDLLRYEILFHEGGVYIDHDMECFQPFDRLHQTYDFYACLEPLWQSDTTETQFKVGNCLIAVKPSHPILRGTMEIVEEGWDKFTAQFPKDDRISNFLRVIHRTFDPFTFGIKANINQEKNRDIVLPPVFCFAPYVYPPEKLPSLKEQGLSLANHFWQNTWVDEKKQQEPLIINRPKQLHHLIQKISSKLEFLMFINIAVCFFNLILLLLFLKKRRAAAIVLEKHQ